MEKQVNTFENLVEEELRNEYGKHSFKQKKSLEHGYIYEESTNDKEYLIVPINSSEGRIKFLMTEITNNDNYLTEDLVDLFANKESNYIKHKNGLVTRQNVMHEDIQKILDYHVTLS